MQSHPHPGDQTEPDEASEESLEPSKSQRKRDADEVRDFARLLTTLPNRKLRQIDLPADVKEAIQQCPPTATRGAHKRHLQFISKLLRKSGQVDEWKAQLENPRPKKNTDAEHEVFRDKLICQFADHVDALREMYPLADLQKVRQLVRQINAADISDADTANDTAATATDVRAKKQIKESAQGIAELTAQQ